ncbi:exodeoxyribonuclease VII large subunit [Schaalia odontolytica]|uniref:exodeoxyribonuclease VII large subunit n=1 Tax=Schaalia odontolytica TaxID=1660 RepID=UPI001C3FBB63|nr:exodeoxyribonuclease VII large subunit [Schaalia odontolytica]WMS26981.1 exodeoxyribonuclease VII large subunit [Schaalia odontolytica]
MLSGVTLPDTPAAPPPGGSPQPRPPAAKAADTTRDNPWPLRRLTENIKVYVDRMSPLWVEGQVVEYKVRPGAKMHFLTLRDLDTDTSMTVTAWAGVMDSTPLTEGARVVTRVKPVFWERSGRLNLQAAEIHLQGVGDLLAQIEALRARLAAEGLFSDARKQPLPFLPRTIGLICGRNAKAKDDVVVNASDRWPTARFEIREVAVQGDHCVPEVGRALLELDAMEGVDVIVIARGGGSVEDLLPFSDERLVRAVAGARTPIVSAIGHEGDSPLLDLVADYRASTPTDAARRIVPDRARERDGITQSLSRMRGALGARLATERSNLTLIASRPVLQGPEAIVEGHRAALTQRVTALRSAIERRLSSERQQLTRSRATLTALSPQATLDRGYALLKTPSGALITSSARVKKGDLIEGILASGRMVAQVVGATTPTPPPDATPQDA